MHPTTAAIILARHTVTVALENGDLFIAPLMDQLGCPDLTKSDWERVRAALMILAGELGDTSDRDIRDAVHALTERGWAAADGEVDAK